MRYQIGNALRCTCEVSLPSNTYIRFRCSNILKLTTRIKSIDRPQKSKAIRKVLIHLETPKSLNLNHQPCRLKELGQSQTTNPTKMNSIPQYFADKEHRFSTSSSASSSKSGSLRKSRHSISADVKSRKSLLQRLWKAFVPKTHRESPAHGGAHSPGYITMGY
jgi:hypothetical protein